MPAASITSPANGAVDIAQNVQFTVNPGSSNTVVLQWNEPFDPKPPTPVGAPFASGTGTVPAGGFADFTFNGTAGQKVDDLRRRGHGDDRHVDSRHRAGTVQPDQRARWPTKDTGTNPELFALELPATGTYTRPSSTASYAGPSAATSCIDVSNAELPEPVLSDYNLLFFRSTGAVPRRAGRAEHAHESSGRARRHQCNRARFRS